MFFNGWIFCIAGLLAVFFVSCGGLIDKGERRSDSATTNGGRENVAPSVDGERDEVETPSEDPQKGSSGGTSSNCACLKGNRPVAAIGMM